MSIQDIIEQIQAKNPHFTAAQIFEQLADERDKSGGLLSDETLMRLIAAKSGVSVKQNLFNTSSVLLTNRLFAGLYDATVAGRLLAVFRVKTFQGLEKTGKFAKLLLGDESGLLHVILWNEKAELVERGELKAGQTVQLLHCYTREDRYGKVELHLGSKSQIEIQNDSEADSYPSIEKFTTKINSITASSGNIHLLGTVKAVLGKSSFHRNDNNDGVVLRLSFRDDSGEVMVVVWNEKVEEIEKTLRDSPRLLLVNARVKEAKSGLIEVHVDSTTAIQTQ